MPIDGNQGYDNTLVMYRIWVPDDHDSTRDNLWDHPWSVPVVVCPPVEEGVLLKSCKESVVKEGVLSDGGHSCRFKVDAVPTMLDDIPCGFISEAVGDGDADTAVRNKVM